MQDFLPTMPGIVSRIVGHAARVAIDTESDFFDNIRSEFINWQAEIEADMADIGPERIACIVAKVWADIQKLLSLPTWEQPAKE